MAAFIVQPRKHPAQKSTHLPRVFVFFVLYLSEIYTKNAMITYKPIIIQGGRRKDGTWPVKIRVTFKGTSRRLPTTLTCTDSDLTRSGKIKNPTILNKAAELINRMRSTCDDLSPFTLESWTVDEVVAHIKEGMRADSFHLDLFEFADEYLDCKRGRTRNVYETALNALARYLGKRELDVNAITRRMLLDFVAFIESEPYMKWSRGKYIPTEHAKIPGGASSMHIAKISHIYNAARFRYNDEDTGRILIPRSPFDGLKKAYPPGQGQRNLGVDLMQRIIDARPENESERMALYTFVLSFATMGANLADLWAARPFSGDLWIYNRQKTATRRADHAEVRVLLPPEAAPFLERLRGQSGGAWWLNEIHRWKQEHQVSALLNRHLKRWAKREGVEEFTFYAARHTWASLARKLGVEKATVDEALAHVGDFRVADIYAERNWELAWQANAQVLALFRWPSVLESDAPALPVSDTEGEA